MDRCRDDSKAPPRPQRVAALDWLRGLVMVLMVTDHASKAFYVDHLVVDTTMTPGWDGPLPVVPFLHRWMSHLCAPTFVFLAGVGVAFAARRRYAHQPWRFDRYLIVRGLLLIAIDLTLVTWIWGMGIRHLLQVLWAIGGGMIALVAIRRLPLGVALALGLALCAGSELCAGLMLFGIDLASADLTSPPPIDAVTGLLWTGVFAPPELFVIYPLLPWLGMMVLGWCFGCWLRGGGSPTRMLAPWTVGALVVFVVVRWADGYGNFGLHRVDDSWLRWLQVSKYPPSLGFTALELGLMGVVLLALLWFERARQRPVADAHPLVVFGQVPLFFYVVHIPLLEGAARIVGRRYGLGGTWVAIVAALLVLFPLCWLYRRNKRGRAPGSTSSESPERSPEKR